MISKKAKVKKYWKSCQTSCEKGFTLLEVLIGMLIMTGGLLGLALLQSNSVQGNSFANHYAQASFLAQMKMEDLCSEPIYQVGEPKDRGPSDLVGGTNGVEAGLDEDEGAGGIFTRSWSVANVTAFSKEISVTVSWNDAGGAAHNLTFTTQTRGWNN